VIDRSIVSRVGAGGAAGVLAGVAFLSSQKKDRLPADVDLKGALVTTA
jgi:hypothetical protein